MKYEVEQLHGCTIVRGQVPISDFVRLTKGQPKNVLMDTQLADRLGAAYVMGTPEALKVLEQHAPARPVAPEWVSKLSSAAVEWLGVGERGNSSNALFQHLTGYPAVSRNQTTDHPLDVSDFRRCRLLIEKAPELRASLPKMASLSPEWSGLVDNWEKICASMDAEMPQWRTGKGKAPKTFELMNQILYPESPVKKGIKP